MKGGHAFSGPVADPTALRRDRDKREWTRLPAAGRPGTPPPWPLSRQTNRERALWAREWARPQAVMWETNGQEAEVAIYVRSLAFAERPRAPVSARTLLRQQMEALGLSLPGLLRFGWTIEGEEERRPQVARAAGSASARDRLRLVAGDE